MQISCKRLEVKIFSQSGDITPQIAKNRPKIDQNLWMILKIFDQNFLAKTLRNSSIRKVITLKVKFEDLQKFFPVGGHQSWTLRKYFE